MSASPTPEAEQESPPFLSRWRNVYLAVLLHLAVWILLLYLFTASFRPGPA